MEQKSYLLKVPGFRDERGSLAVAELSELPFEAARVFWIYGVEAGRTRGGHAHSTCAEIVFPVKGSFEMWVDDGQQAQTYQMCHANEGIYIGPNVWCELRNFSPDAVCVVFASEPYKAEGYINDYADFCKKFHQHD